MYYYSLCVKPLDLSKGAVSMKQVEDAYNGETIVNSEQKYNFQYHSLSSIGKLQNVFQQGVGIVRKAF